jgi:uncharacterized protein YcfL
VYFSPDTMCWTRVLLLRYDVLNTCTSHQIRCDEHVYFSSDTMWWTRALLIRYDVMNTCTSHQIRCDEHVYFSPDTICWTRVYFTNTVSWTRVLLIRYDVLNTCTSHQTNVLDTCDAGQTKVFNTITVPDTLFSSRALLKKYKTSLTRQARHVARKGTENIHTRFYWGNLDVKTLFEKPRRRCKNEVKLYLT